MQWIQQIRKWAAILVLAIVTAGFINPEPSDDALRQKSAKTEQKMR